jgi:hypothetical protein
MGQKRRSERFDVAQISLYRWVRTYLCCQLSRAVSRIRKYRQDVQGRHVLSLMIPHIN